MLKKYIERLKNSEIIKNIAVLVSGVVIGYGISMLLLPVLSRVYTPEELGEYDLIISNGNIIASLVCLALLIAIMTPEKDEEAVKICKLVRALTNGLSLFVFIILVLISNKMKIFDVKMNYILSVFFLSMYVILFNEQNVFYAYVNRKKKYKVLFWNPIISAVVNSGISILLGALNWGTTGYMTGTLISYMICIIHMRLSVNPYEGKMNISELIETLKRYKVYPKVQLPANMVATVSAQFPIQFLGHVFGNAALGGYTMACKILSVPVTLLATPINRVYYREAAERYVKGEKIGQFCFDMIEKNIKIAIVPIGILIISGKQIVTFFLGEAWTVAGIYISTLGILYLLKYCSSCVSGTFVIIEKQPIALFCSIVSLVLYASCFFMSNILQLNVIKTIILFAIFDGIYNFLNLFLCVYFTGYSIKKYFIFIMKYIVGSMIVIYTIFFYFYS